MRIFRTVMPALMVVGLSVGLSLGVAAQDRPAGGDRLTGFDAPQPVRSAIRELAGENEVTRVGRESEDGATLYEAEYFEDGLKRSIKVTDEGALVELEIGVAAEDLPQAVRDAVAAQMPGAEIEGGEFVHTTHYTVQVSADGQEREIVVSPWGGSRGEEEEGDDEDEGPDEGAEMSEEPAPEHDQFSLVFSNPTEITNPYLPLSLLELVVLEERDGDEVARIERRRVETDREFTINGQTIRVVAIEDRETVDGEIEEITIDYFAQADDGTVYYLGEDVDEYHDGEVVSHGGAWILGRDTDRPGVLMPGTPAIGQRFRAEDVPGITVEEDEVVALDDTVETPAGTFEHCVQIEEHSGREREHKWYAPGVGNISENGEALLVEYR